MSYFDTVWFSDAVILYRRTDVNQFNAIIGVNAPRVGQVFSITLCLLRAATVCMLHWGLSAAVLC